MHSSYVVYFQSVSLSGIVFICNMGIDHLPSKEDGLKFVCLEQITHFHEVTIGAELRQMLLHVSSVSKYYNLYRSKAVMWSNSLNDLENSLREYK